MSYRYKKQDYAINFVDGVDQLHKWHPPSPQSLLDCKMFIQPKHESIDQRCWVAKVYDAR